MIEVCTLEAYIEIFWGLFLFTDVGNIDVNLVVYFRLFLIIVVVGNLDTNIGCCYCILFFYSGIGDLFSIMDMMMGNLDANIGAYLRQRWVVFSKTKYILSLLLLLLKIRVYPTSWSMFLIFILP